MVNEIPCATTPWVKINQLLSPDERFSILIGRGSGFLLSPKSSSQLSALMFLLHQENLSIFIQGEGDEFFPLKENSFFNDHFVIVSTRYLNQIVFHEQGIVEIGGGCTLLSLNQFLNENQYEVPFEEGILDSNKSLVAGILLFGRVIKCQHESISDNILGIEFVTSDGSQVRWGGSHLSPIAGPSLQRLFFGLETFPGVIVKLILKVRPIPEQRLKLAWKYAEREYLLKHFNELKNYCSEWEQLEMVISGDINEACFLFAQVSGLTKEMEAFAQGCPKFEQASQKRERMLLKNYFKQQKLSATLCQYSIVMNRDIKHEIKKLFLEDYIWMQEGNEYSYILTSRKIPLVKNEEEMPVWKIRLFQSVLYHPPTF